MNIDMKELSNLSKLSFEDGVLEGQEAVVKAQLEAMLEKLRLPEVLDITMELTRENAMELRPDIAEPSLSREQVLQNAPQKQAGCFVVPKTV